MTHDLPLGCSQAVRRMHLGNTYTRHTRTGGNGHDPQGGKEQQDDLTDFANTGPNDHKRDQCKRWNRTHEFHNRVKPPTEPVGQAHRITQRNTNNCTQQETDDHAEKREPKVFGQGRVTETRCGDLTQTGQNSLWGRQPNRFHLPAS